MRYRRGTIELSSELDTPLLRLVHRAGHVRFDQIYDSLYLARQKRCWDTLSWRIRRLVQHGLLDQTHVPGLQGIVVSLGESGEFYLQSHEMFLVERATRSRGATKRHQIWHDVDLFGIQLALRRAGVVALWESEAEVRAKNDFTTNHYAKDYDAVVTFQCGVKRGKLALEYERTPKWTKEYERISKELQIEARVNTFLYLVPNIELRSLLLHALRNTGLCMLVAIASEFSGDPCNAELIDIRTHLRRRLDDCLS